jgi:hypothetical protein
VLCALCCAVRPLACLQACWVSVAAQHLTARALCPPCARTQVAVRLSIVAACWLALLAFKMLFGYCLKLIAHRYTRYFTPAHSHHGHAAAMLAAKGGTMASRLSRVAPNSKDTPTVTPCASLKRS